MSKAVIVGAGVSGLALAYRLVQAAPHLEITVLEKANRPGGTVWTERQAGYQVEFGPNGFLDNKPSTLNLCRDLGLNDQLVPASDLARRNRYLLIDNKLTRVPDSVLSFLGTKLLSWRGKWDIFLERVRPTGPQSSDESIDAFVRRRAGGEAAEVLADALVTGIHAGDPKLLSVHAAFPRLPALEAEYGSVLAGFGQVSRQRRQEAARANKPKPEPNRMWSVRKGLRELIEALTARIPQRPLLGAGVRHLEKTGGGWIVRGDGQDRWDATAVVLTCPAYEQAALLSKLDQQLSEQIAGIAYNRVVVVALGYREIDVPFKPNGFGFIAPERQRRDILGVQWCSSIFPERAPENMVLFRVLCGGWHRPDIVDYDDDRLLTAVRAELRLAQGIVAAPAFHQIIRWDKAIPQYHLGHLDRVAEIERLTAGHPGLFLAGNCYRGIALNDCTEQAGVIAEKVAAYCGKNW